jgi:hypothetical protein
MENGANSKKRPGVEMKRREGKADLGLADLGGPASRDGCPNPVSRLGHLTPISRPGQRKTNWLLKPSNLR